MRETRRTGDLRIGFVRIFQQPEQVRRLEWRYIAHCQAGAARPTGVTIERTRTTEDTEAFVTVIPGTDPSNADRIWHNVWYAVCRGEFNKYPRNPD